MSWKENFINGIIAISEHKNWDEAIKEWKLRGTYLEASSCLCGHDIVENCVMINILNGKETIVGNCCIKKFPSYLNRNDLPLAFKSLANNKINDSLIELSYELGYINDWEYGFMMDVWRKRSFTEKQRIVFEKIKSTVFCAMNRHGVKKKMNLTLDFIRYCVVVGCYPSHV